MSSRAYQTSRLRIAGELAHRLPVAARGRADQRRRAVVRSKPRSRPAIAKLAASRFTSHSHGPGQRLVEVVDVEDELALGRGEHAEVGEVGVPAELHA